MKAAISNDELTGTVLLQPYLLASFPSDYEEFLGLPTGIEWATPTYITHAWLDSQWKRVRRLEPGIQYAVERERNLAAYEEQLKKDEAATLAYLARIREQLAALGKPITR